MQYYFSIETLSNIFSSSSSENTLARRTKTEVWKLTSLCSTCGAEQAWRRLSAPEWLPLVSSGLLSKDGTMS